jgi:hypothetical protein
MKSSSWSGRRCHEAILQQVERKTRGAGRFFMKGKMYTNIQRGIGRKKANIYGVFGKCINTFLILDDDKKCFNISANLSRIWATRSEFWAPAGVTASVHFCLWGPKTQASQENIWPAAK